MYINGKQTSNNQKQIYLQQKQFKNHYQNGQQVKILSKQTELIKFSNKGQSNTLNIHNQNNQTLNQKYTIQFNQQQDINLLQQLNDNEQQFPQVIQQIEMNANNGKTKKNNNNDPFQQQNFVQQEDKNNPVLVNNYSYFIQHQYVPVHLIYTQDQITHNNLYLGDVSSALDMQFIKNSNIKTVVTAGAQMDQVSFKNQKNQIKHVIYGVLDHKNQNLIQYFDQFYDLVEKAFHKGSILVHCAAGISRSSTLVISYLMKKKIWTFKEAITFVRSKRSSVLPNLGFQRQLKQYEKILIKQNHRKIKSKTSQSSKHHNNNYNNISSNNAQNKLIINPPKNNYEDTKMNFNQQNTKNKKKNLIRQQTKDFLCQQYQEQILPQLISISDHRNNRNNNQNNYHHNNNNIKNLKITQGMGIFINQHNNIYNQYQNPQYLNLNNNQNGNNNSQSSNNNNTNQNNQNNQNNIKFKYKHNMFLNNFYYKNNKRTTGYLNTNNNGNNNNNQYNNKFNINAGILPKNAIKSKSPLPLNNQGQYNNNNNIYNQKNVSNSQPYPNAFNQLNQPQINIQITNNVNININPNNTKNLSTKFNNFSQEDLLNGKLSNILSPTISNQYKNINENGNIPSVISYQNAKYSLDKNGQNFRSSNYYYNNNNNISQNNAMSLSKEKSNFPLFVNKSQKNQLLATTNHGLFDSAIIPIKYSNIPGRAQTDSTNRSPLKNNLTQNQKLIIRKIPVNNLNVLNLNSFNENNNIRSSLKQKYSNSEIKDSNIQINIQNYSNKIDDIKNSIKYPIKKGIQMRNNLTEEFGGQIEQNKNRNVAEKSRNSLKNRLKALQGKNLSLKPVQITQILK